MQKILGLHFHTRQLAINLSDKIFQRRIDRKRKNFRIIIVKVATNEQPRLNYNNNGLRRCARGPGDKAYGPTYARVERSRSNHSQTIFQLEKHLLLKYLSEMPLKTINKVISVHHLINAYICMHEICVFNSSRRTNLPLIPS